VRTLVERPAGSFAVETVYIKDLFALFLLEYCKSFVHMGTRYL
jgi:hypothetical protein